MIPRRTALLTTLCVVSAAAVAPGALDPSAPASTASAATAPERPLRFGVYPWGNVGATDPVYGATPESPQLSLDAVRELRGNKSFVVHLYGAYTGTDEAAASRLLRDARWWSDHGIQVEMVLRYRPARRALAPGYSSWVRWTAKRLARIRRVVAIQVGNEANSRDAAAAADGAYPGAVTRIARAVPVARRAVVGAGRRDIGIGVNWAAGRRPCSSGSFWRGLRKAGGRSFSRSVGWVGVDVYPGTWTGPSRSATPTPAQVDRVITSTLRCARKRHLPAAGLGRRVSLTVAETGYPTDPSRSEELQQTVLVSTVGAVLRVAGRYGVTDLRWFPLRDANTGSGQLENGYGLVRDDATRKAAFWTYRDLVAGSGR